MPKLTYTLKYYNKARQLRLKIIRGVNILLVWPNGVEKIDLILKSDGFSCVCVVEKVLSSRIYIDWMMMSLAFWNCCSTFNSSFFCCDAPAFNCITLFEIQTKFLWFFFRFCLRKSLQMVCELFTYRYFNRILRSLLKKTDACNHRFSSV